jgi:predicted amidohydrolase YtcJ
MGVWGGRVNLSQARSASEVLKAVGTRARESKEGQWVLGRGWDESKWSDTKYITKKDLDAVSPKNPVLLVRVCGHMCAVNSKALSLLEGKLGKRGLDGRTGLLTEKAVEQALEAVKPTFEEMLEGLERSTVQAHRLGVTSVHDIIDRHKLMAYSALYGRRELGIRTCLHFEEGDMRDMARLGIKTGYGNHFLRAGGIKLYADGSFGARTAALTQPYSDDESTKGELLFDQEKLRTIIRTCERTGLQVLVHAIGDAAVDRTLKAFSFAQMKPTRLRHRMEHLELVDGKGLDIMERLSLWASMQPNFVGEWGMAGGMMHSRLGKRYEQADPMKRVLDSGVPLIFGSDCMPLSPLYGIHSAVNAPFRDQKLDVADALAAYTATAAGASFEEDFKGTFAPGTAADMVLLSDDPLEKPARISRIRVEATVIAGRPVWRASGAPL